MLQVGVASTDITPPIGAELCGYGYYLQRACTGVLDPLRARAVYLESGDDRALFIGNDLVGVDRELTDKTRDLCLERLGLAHDSVMLTATHTHSGPATLRLYGCGVPDSLYWDHLPYVWADLAQAAMRDARPATFSMARGPIEPVGCDRHTGGGPVDAELRILQFKTDNKVRALLVNHSAHAVVFSRENTLVSGGWPGAMERAIEHALPGAVGVLVQGSCGTLNPIERQFGADVDATVIERTGRRVADAALAIADQAQPVQDPAPIRCVRETDRLPAHVMPPADLADQRDTYRAAVNDVDRPYPERAMARVRAGVCQKLLDTHPGDAPLTYPAEVQTFHIGPARIAGIPGELFMSLGQRILDAPTDGVTFIAGYANEWVGYLPTRDAYGDDRFVYPTTDACHLRGWFPFQPGVGERITDTAIRQCE
ncbi:MAG: hypothetical protein GY851_32845 [bacterium]|nr:hypothetical protein [bacterium]